MTLKDLREIVTDMCKAGYGKQPLVCPNDSLMESGKPIPSVSVALFPFDEGSAKPKIRLIIKNENLPTKL